MAIKGTTAIVNITGKADQASNQLRNFGKEVENLGKKDKKRNEATKLASKGALKAKDANDQLKGTMRQLASSIAVVDGPLGGIASRFNAFGTTLGRVDKKLIGITAAFIGFAAVARVGLRAFGDVEQLNFRLDAAMEATGRNIRNTSAEFKMFAEQLGRDTLTSNEAALEAIASVATFENIPTEKITEIVGLSQDLSVVWGGDLKQNALLLARALNDPEKASEQLRRKGVLLNNQQKEQIKTFVEQGDRLSAINIVLKEYANIQGIAAKEAQGIKGVFDTLGESLRRTTRTFVENAGVVTAFKGLGLALTGVLDGLALTLNVLDSALKTVKDTMLLWGPVVIALALTHVPNLIKSLVALNAQISILSFMKLNQALIGLVATINVATFGLTGFAAALAGVKAVIGLIPFWAVMTAGLAAATTALMALRDDLNSFGDVWGAFRVGGLWATSRIKIAMLELRVSVAETMALLKTIAAFKPGGESPSDVAAREFAKLAVIRKEAQDAQLETEKDFQKRLRELAGIADPHERALVVDVVDPGSSDDQIKRLENLNAQNQALKEQVAVNNLLISGEEKFASIAKLRIQLKNEELDAGKKIIRDMITQQTKLEEQSKELERQGRIRQAIQSSGEELKNLTNENDAIRRVISGKSESLKIAEMQIRAEQALSEEERKNIKQQIQKIRIQEELNKTLEAQQQIAEGIKSAFKDTFAELIRGAESFRDALAKLEDKLMDILLNAALEGIASDISKTSTGKDTGNFFNQLIGSFIGSAKGNVFKGQDVVPFAKGGVISSPIVFPLRSGTGLAGEKGPEAIMPLTRTSRGELGVKSQGGGGTTVNVSMSITTPDADSFRKSQGQILREMQMATSRASSRNG